MSNMPKFVIEDEVPVPTPAATTVVSEEAADAAVRTQAVKSGTPVNTTALAQQAVQKMQAIEKEINDRVLEREAPIHDMLLGLATGKHALLLGPPGTGKSYLIREMQSHVEKAQKFEWLLNRTSDPAEILGPFSIKAMENDKFKRVSTGKLPEAHLAFLDEIYKCNEPTLNILLPILNEGIFFNDGKAEPVALRFLLAASNEEPEDESLAALHDRLVFRHYVDYLHDSGNKIKVMKMASEGRNPATASKTQRTMVSLEEIDALRGYVNSVEVADGVIKQFEKLLRELDKKSIKISDRRMNASVHIMQAEAALNGRDKVALDDMKALIHVLWEKKEDIKEIEAEILKLVNPYDSEIKKLIDKAIEIRDKTMGLTNKADRAGAAVDAKDNLEKILSKLDKVIKDAGNNGKDTTAMMKKRNDIVTMNNDIIKACLGLASDSVGVGKDSESMPF